MWTTAMENRSPYFLLSLLLLIFNPVRVLCRDINVVRQQFVSDNLEDVLIARRFGQIGDGSGLPIGLYRELKKLLTFPTALTTDENVNRQCVEDSLFYLDNVLHEGSNWAVKMMESSGQLPAGIVGDDSFHAEGLFDECLAVRSEPDRFKGKYCTVFFKLESVGQSETIFQDSAIEDHGRSETILYVLRRLFGMAVDSTMKIKPKISQSDTYSSILNYPSFSFCLPSSCSASDLGHSIAQMVGSYVIGNQSVVTVADDNLCLSDDQALPPIDGPVIVVLLIFAFNAILLTSATVHEIWRNHHGIGFTKTDSKAVTALHCFSLISNARKLLSFKPEISGPDNLSCLSGIRFLSACAVIFFHSILKFSAAGKGSLASSSTFERISQNWKYLIFTNSTVSVDTFLVISGMLVSFNLFRELDKTSGKINLKKFYIQRYLRLTPIYAVMIGIVATISVFLGSGPAWYIIDLGSKMCRKNWWTHVLYINNMYQFDVNDSCMGDSWYLAADMQLYIVAPIFVYCLWRWKKIGLAILGVVLLASLITKATILTIYDLPPTMIHTLKGELFQDFVNYMDRVYVKPWTRAPPYLIGILTGLFLHRMKHVKLQISMKNVSLLWALSVGTILVVIFGFNPSAYEKTVPMIDWLVRLMYSSLHRTAWALAIAWIIIACIHGYGGFVNRFLSWEGFLPLSRLSYCIYLYQFNHIHLNFAFSHKLFHFSGMNYLITVFGIMIVVFAVAFIMAITVEIPFTDLTKLLFAPNSKSSLETKTEKSEEIPAVSENKDNIEEIMRNNLAKRKTA